jgi:hypothetical protein
MEVLRRRGAQQYPASNWREQSHAFEDLAVVLRPEGSQVILASEAEPEKIQGAKNDGIRLRLA